LQIEDGTPRIGAFGVSGYLAWHIISLLFFRYAPCTKESSGGRKEKKALHGWKAEKAFTSVHAGLNGLAGHEDVEPFLDDRFIPECSG
jgi:hypothetical protein